MILLLFDIFGRVQCKMGQRIDHNQNIPNNTTDANCCDV